jgi:catechol 2,3-dioxygenase-like lactoylglutathione lyase family enzyme
MADPPVQVRGLCHVALRVRERGVPIVHEPRGHRDGSVSFYCRDPDGNLVQVLWLPRTASE